MAHYYVLVCILQATLQNRYMYSSSYICSYSTCEYKLGKEMGKKKETKFLSNLCPHNHDWTSRQRQTRGQGSHAKAMSNLQSLTYSPGALVCVCMGALALSPDLHRAPGMGTAGISLKGAGHDLWCRWKRRSFKSTVDRNPLVSHGLG